MITPPPPHHHHHHHVKLANSIQFVWSQFKILKGKFYVLKDLQEMFEGTDSLFNAHKIPHSIEKLTKKRWIVSK